VVELKNPALEKLRAGELAVGIGLRQARTADIAKVMVTAGYDWLFIDLEHNSMNLDTAVQISIAAQASGIAPIVRVPSHQPHHATRVLDGGAQGIVVPHVDDVETARRIATSCRYPPRGHRSVIGGLPQLNFESVPIKDATEIVDRETLIVLMLESPTAIENAEAIAAIEGIDALLIGTNDLCMEMGIPGQLDHADIEAAYREMISACAKHKKYPGMGGVYAPALMKKYIDLGSRFILAGNDLTFMLEGARQQANTVRSLR